MQKLILIRHGETDYTRARRYCGHEDIPLNAEGKKQARRLASKLKSIKTDRIYSSDLERAFETAQIAFPNKTIFKRKGLREINFGKFSGLTYEELAVAHPRAYKAWMESPETVKIPGGECLPVFAKRVKRCFGRIGNQNPRKTVIIVAHGGTIRIILLKLMKKPLSKIWEIEQKTAAVSVVRSNEVKYG